MKKFVDAELLEQMYSRTQTLTASGESWQQQLLLPRGISMELVSFLLLFYDDDCIQAMARPVGSGSSELELCKKDSLFESFRSKSIMLTSWSWEVRRGRMGGEKDANICPSSLVMTVV